MSNLISTQDIFLISPLITLFLFSLIPITMKVLNQNKEPSSFYSITLPALGIIISLALGLFIFAYHMIYKADHMIFYDSLLVNGNSLISLFLIGVLTLYTLVTSVESSVPKERLSEWVFLLLNASLGMILFSWSQEFLIAFVGLELFSFALYTMIILNSEKTLSKEAAIKYFVLGSLASAFFIYGVSFLYGTTGTTYFHEMALTAGGLFSVSRLFVVGICLVFTGLLFKVAAFPFHWWTPDVYQGASSHLTGFMATAVKVSVFVFFLNFMGIGFIPFEKGEIHSFQITFMWISVFTMLVGNMGALFQNSIKRMLAYSGIAHSGYILIGIMVSPFSEFGSSAVLFYLLSYILPTIGLFSVLVLFETKDRLHVSFDDLKGLAYRNPYLAVCITVFTLSLLGIPLTAGFFGKFFLLNASLGSKMYWISIWAVLNSVLSAYYYLRPSVMMFMKEEPGLVPQNLPLTKNVIVISVTLVITLGLAATPFYHFIQAGIN